MSYLRDDPRYSREYDTSLPSIGQRSGLVNGRGTDRIGSLEDISPYCDTDKHVRFTETTTRSGTTVRDREDSPVFYPRPPSPTHAHNRRQMLELQDQLKLYREELTNKDKLISQLSSCDAPPSLKRIDTTTIEETFSSDRLAAAAMAKSEAAALQVRVEGLQSELRETRSQVEIREEKIRDLKLEVETERESNAKHMTLAQSLRQQLIRFEAEAGSLEGAASRSELAVHTLQTQNNDLQNRILELESRLRNHLEDRESAEQRASEWEKRYQKMRLSLASSLNIDLSVTSDISFDLASARISDLVQENTSLKSKISSWKDYTSNAEMENKASRETIQRLAAEVDREKQRSSRVVLDVESLRNERDEAVARLNEFETETFQLRERLETNQRAWTTTRKELEDREGRVNILDREAKDSIILAKTSEQQLKSFKEQLVSLLSDSKVTVEPFEEAIRDRIKLLIQSSKERYATAEILERKLTEVSEQLEQHRELSRSAERRAQRLEVQFHDVEQRLVSKQDEIASADVLREGLRADKERYYRFLEELSHIMCMDPISADIGIDMASEAVVGRARQLISLEADALQDRKTTIYNLQRKLKGFKEQLESKDLHLDLLRKKVTSLEGRLSGKSDIEKERDNETLKNRKIAKLAEKYKKELQDAHFEIRDLKSRLLESSDIKSRTLVQEKELDVLESKVGQLERVRQKQADHIAGLRDNLHSTVNEMDSKRNTCNTTIQNMTSELRTTKTTLTETQHREQQLLDLRQVLARMLGLDVNTLAVPDYEIISRLEKLILANQSNAVATSVIDGTLRGMNESFQAGYQDATRTIQTRSRSPVRTSTMTTTRTRTRSSSPTKRDLTRAY